MKIAFFELEGWEKDYLKEKLKNHELNFFEEELNDSNMTQVKDFDIISPFIYSIMKKDVIKQFKNLRFIATRSTGFDHIDINFCNQSKIRISNVPSYGENTVAEHTFALILALSRKIHKAYQRTILGNFSLEGLKGFDLKRKTLGLVGLGHIGQHVARMANGFEMDILAYDPFPDKRFVKKYKIKLVALNTLLQNSDIISLHCPLNKNTFHILNKKTMKQIKKGAYLINTARGSLIETDSLVRALDSGNLAGAGLDVIEEESLIKEEKQLLSKNFLKQNLKNLLKNHILLRFDNVIITPHNAFYSNEALLRILDTTVDNIKSFINKRPINLVR